MLPSTVLPSLSAHALNLLAPTLPRPQESAAIIVVTKNGKTLQIPDTSGHQHNGHHPRKLPKALHAQNGHRARQEEAKKPEKITLSDIIDQVIEDGQGERLLNEYHGYSGFTKAKLTHIQDLARNWEEPRHTERDVLALRAALEQLGYPTPGISNAELHAKARSNENAQRLNPADKPTKKERSLSQKRRDEDRGALRGSFGISSVDNNIGLLYQNAGIEKPHLEDTQTLQSFVGSILNLSSEWAYELEERSGIGIHALTDFIEGDRNALTSEKISDLREATYHLYLDFCEDYGVADAPSFEEFDY